MPNSRTQLSEKLAWRALDKYVADNPKPRLSARIRHRCKLWIIGRLGDYIVLDPADRQLDTYVFPINQQTAAQMLDYARRTIDD